ncbi:MAG: hypothetical protein PHY99_05410 [Bacteroidales bacterium]|nr:hypothetical protein [Bacteroidales bacterium]
MLLTLLLISIILVALAFAGLGISILFRRNGKFPETEVGQNKHMKDLGITCVKKNEPMSGCGHGCSCGHL